MAVHDFDIVRFVRGDDPIEEGHAIGRVIVDQGIAVIGAVDPTMVLMKAVSRALVHIDNSRRCSYGYDQRVEAFGATATDAKEPLLEFFIERYA
jgi:myo-inositol 2-dehydrogenase/D-chiro-inositol 1-dehydrogenase